MTENMTMYSLFDRNDNGEYNLWDSYVNVSMNSTELTAEGRLSHVGMNYQDHVCEHRNRTPTKWNQAFANQDVRIMFSQYSVTTNITMSFRIKLIFFSITQASRLLVTNRRFRRQEERHYLNIIAPFDECSSVSPLTDKLCKSWRKHPSKRDCLVHTSTCPSTEHVYFFCCPPHIRDKNSFQCVWYGHKGRPKGGRWR